MEKKKGGRKRKKVAGPFLAGRPRGRNDWQPFHSNYKDYREYAQGAGWKVWVGLPNNPEFQQAPHRGALPIPEYKEAKEMNVPDEWLD